MGRRRIVQAFTLTFPQHQYNETNINQRSFQFNMFAYRQNKLSIQYVCLPTQEVLKFNMFALQQNNNSICLLTNKTSSQFNMFAYQRNKFSIQYVCSPTKEVPKFNMFAYQQNKLSCHFCNFEKEMSRGRRYDDFGFKQVINEN